jgi:hypothetical protein
MLVQVHPFQMSLIVFALTPYFAATFALFPLILKVTYDFFCMPVPVLSPEFAADGPAQSRCGLGMWHADVVILG